MASRTQTALLLTAERGEFQLGSRPVPSPKAGEVLVQNVASALNPFDWKVQTTGFMGPKVYPAVLGFEGAGVIEEVGKGVEGIGFATERTRVSCTVKDRRSSSIASPGRTSS